MEARALDKWLWRHESIKDLVDWTTECAGQVELPNSNKLFRKSLKIFFLEFMLDNWVKFNLTQRKFINSF